MSGLRMIPGPDPGACPTCGEWRKAGLRHDCKVPPRPWCCPEHSCRPIHQLTNGSVADADAGESFVCFGQMARPVEFVYDGVPHRNTLNSCHYTPLKGVVRWQENRDDWAMLAAAYTEALALLPDGKAGE